MFKRILVVGVVVAVAAAFMPAQTAEARDGYYRRGCDTCGRVVAIESAGRRDNRVGGGAVLGAIVGGALGNQVGKGDGRKAATVVGALAGGAIGHDIEKQGRRSNYYYRISVRMDRDGRIRTYDQHDVYGLRRGDRVYIDRGEVIPAR
ncbi:glycine zipper 2TM domain-containing protein [Dokdonella sp.]|uniref:glycine zipper 2TM domain-containing protein n=1 Tax=Dokdonella sp. TaxID=2291710 RepID=UPI0025C654C3|nr:glycine zipper 2TM domain-containing protein [Dokdonella sp.]MBX3692597.1 glycine zipper 2TM domain-containing protein [Dokdonella sp.]MCW5569033.1 glycine zipper 2TM domain-containing protein [Dokdonella sp.]